MNRWDMLGLKEDIIVEGEFVMQASWREKEAGWFDGGIDFAISFPLGVSIGTSTGFGFKQDGPVTTEQLSGKQPQEVDPPKGYKWKDDAWVHKTVAEDKKLWVISTLMEWYDLGPAMGTTWHSYKQKTTIYWKRKAECIKE